MRTKWTTADIPDQRDRVAVITGANAGIGYETAAVLADKGALVVLAVRNLDKGKEAAARIASQSPHASVAVQRLDLASLESVRAAAKELRAAYPKIDLLINNAGVMWTPKGKTADGFEMQFGTNHLGHFALTGLLSDCMNGVAGSRVISIGSLAHRGGYPVDFDDPQWEDRYKRAPAYSQSKLANLLFTYELNRRLAARGVGTVAVAAHPGGCYSQQVSDGPRLTKPILRVVFQSPSKGALPPLRAATDPAVLGGQYYGPDGLGQVRGHPKLVKSSQQSYDANLQKHLWEVSEKLTGVTYPV